MRLMTAEQLRRLDRRAIEEGGIPSLTLMERAAEHLAKAAAEGFPAPGRAAVVCGSGNNGGDGFAAACLLLQAGWAVRVLFVGRREKMTADCRAMARRFLALGGGAADYDPADGGQAAFLAAADLVIDALFGVGLSRPVEGISAQAVAAMNAAGGLVAAADMPSGLHSDTGAVMGCAVKADRTVTFTERKLGQLLGKGPLYCGEVLLADIGIPAALAAEERPAAVGVDRDWVRRRLPPRPADGHKGTFGSAYLLAGSRRYAGAPLLASRAAVRGGCGLVFLGVPESVWPAVAARCLEEMPQPLPERDGALGLKALPAARSEMERCSAALIGPGLGRGAETAAAVRALAEALPGPLVLDADGINALEGHIDVLEGRRGRTTVLTPHPGEFARLGGGGEPLPAARDFAVRYGCTLVLKGHRTVTAAPDGSCFVNTTGGSGLAKGGSGDVLAGLITSLLAQGAAPWEAAAAAVWIHGRAGELLERERTAYAMAPGQLPEAFSAVFRELLAEEPRGAGPERLFC